MAFLRNDDELAGLLGHEMGHILTHQGGIRMTRLFREVLDVTTVGDWKDILDKFNQLLDNAARNPKAFQPDRTDEEPHQYQADQVALFAVARAGYSTQAFVDFFDRLAQTHGKTGSFLSDVLGHTKPNEKRLREIHKSLDNLPASCKRLAASRASDEFLKWLAEIVAYSGTGRKDSLTGIIKKENLDPPLRTDLMFSRRTTPVSLCLLVNHCLCSFALTLRKRMPHSSLQIPKAWFSTPAGCEWRNGTSPINSAQGFTKSSFQTAASRHF